MARSTGSSIEDDGIGIAPSAPESIFDTFAQAGMNADRVEKAPLQVVAPAPEAPVRVFLMENHDDTRQVIRMLLEHMGHVVGTAHSMEEALARLEAAPWDVLVSDIGLPDGTGWELVERLGESRPRHCIAISGFGQPSDRRRSLDAGFREHLLKPIRIEALEKLIQTAAADRRGQAGPTLSATRRG